MTRISIDCAPALRTKVIRELVRLPARARTAEIAEAVDTATKTASRYLEDLSILKLATRAKQSEASNAPDFWEATDWLRQYWPESETEKYVHAHHPPFKEKSKTEKYAHAYEHSKRGGSQDKESAEQDGNSACLRTSQSHSVPAWVDEPAGEDIPGDPVADREAAALEDDPLEPLRQKLVASGLVAPGTLLELVSE